MKYKTSLLLNHKNTNISTCQVQSFHCQEKSLSICTDNQKAGFCIMEKPDWKINLVLNMAYIYNALVINALIFANNIIIQRKSKKRCTVQLGFFANTFSCSPIFVQLHLTGFMMFCWNVCPVWSFLPCHSWFDKYTLVSRSLFLMIHWQRALQ